jgi:hypothetical protein
MKPALKNVIAACAWLIADNWRVVLYALLILLCALFAPEEPLKFIYTEF